MNKQIILFSLFLSSFVAINACDHLKKDLRKLHSKMSAARKQNDSEQIKKLEAKLNKISYPNELCNEMEDEYSKMRSDKDLTRAYANLGEFAYAHFNGYPDNANLLLRRLDIFALGMYIRSYDISRKNAVNDAYKKIKAAIGIDSHSASSESKEDFESPQAMYIDVRDLCDNNKHLNNWGTKNYILDTLATGLEEECRIHNGQDCEDMSRRLYEWFINKNYSNN